MWRDKTSRGLKHKSENKLQKIENWKVAEKLKINNIKTNNNIFLNQTKANKHEKVCIRVTNKKIAEHKSVKYLGVTADNKLSWEQHTQSVVKKLSVARSIICKLSHYAPFSISRNVYSISCTQTCNIVLLHGEVPLKSMLKRFRYNITILSNSLRNIHLFRQN